MNKQQIILLALVLGGTATFLGPLGFGIAAIIGGLKVAHEAFKTRESSSYESVNYIRDGINRVCDPIDMVTKGVVDLPVLVAKQFESPKLEKDGHQNVMVRARSNSVPSKSIEGKKMVQPR